MKRLTLSALIAMLLAAPVIAALGAPPAPSAKPSAGAPARQLKGAVPPPRSPAERQERMANRQRYQKAMQEYLKGNPAEQQKATEERNKHKQAMQDIFKRLSETKDPAARQQLLKEQQEKMDAHYRQMQEQLKRFAAASKK